MGQLGLTARGVDHLESVYDLGRVAGVGRVRFSLMSVIVLVMALTLASFAPARAGGGEAGLGGEAERSSFCVEPLTPDFRLLLLVGGQSVGVERVAQAFRLRCKGAFDS